MEAARVGTEREDGRMSWIARKAAERRWRRFNIECRWGGPATSACWNSGACGCFPTSVAEVWAEAQRDHCRSLRTLSESCLGRRWTRV